jgi:outer membrane protein TolC
MKALILRPFCIVLLLLTAIGAAAEPLPFRRAMELAAQRGSASAAAADQQRAQAGYQEARNMFLPQLVVGSGLGKTFGFPMSIEGAAPSVFNVNYQSFLINPAQREFIRSAKQDWMASASTAQDQRASSLLETAITYIQLDTLTARAHVLQRQQDEANRLVTIVNDRVEAGVEPPLELTRSRLAAAQVRMRLADAAGAADVLRERLAQLIGLPAASIETVNESIPAVPDLSREQDLVPAALSSSPVVKAAEQSAAAKALRAKGEHKMMYPAIDAVASYGLFSRFNNFEDFFKQFQRHNATLGVAIRFPFLNYPQKAHAEAADAEAVKAQRQTETTKQQVSTDTIKLARSVEQLSAAQQVAQLDYQLAQAQADALQERIRAVAPGIVATAGQPSAPAPGPRDLQMARLQVSDKYSTYLDTTFELDKTRLQLLRATGRLEGWALGK